MWRESSTRQNTVRKVDGLAGLIFVFTTHTKNGTHFQISGRRQTTQETRGRKSLDGVLILTGWTELWWWQALSLMLPNQLNVHCDPLFIFLCFVCAKNHPTFAICISQMFMRSYYIQLFGTITFLLLITFALFNNKHSATRAEGRIVQVSHLNTSFSLSLVLETWLIFLSNLKHI